MHSERSNRHQLPRIPCVTRRNLVDGRTMIDRISGHAHRDACYLCPPRRIAAIVDTLTAGARLAVAKKPSKSAVAEVVATAAGLDLPAQRPSVDTTTLPFETAQLRKGLEDYLATRLDEGGAQLMLGNVKCGVYAFFDYDGVPIYIGQTIERLGTRIRRHLSGQRSDAVAKSVLDPFEVHSICVWPLVEYQSGSVDVAERRKHLDALEHAAYLKVVADAGEDAVLNEKTIAVPDTPRQLPAKYMGTIVSDAVSKVKDHPDLRLARRAATVAKLAQVISERQVGKGLRRTLLKQTQRLQKLATQRLGGAPDTAEEVDAEEDG